MFPARASGSAMCHKRHTAAMEPSNCSGRSQVLAVPWKAALHSWLLIALEGSK